MMKVYGKCKVWIMERRRNEMWDYGTSESTFENHIKLTILYSAFNFQLECPILSYSQTNKMQIIRFKCTHYMLYKRNTRDFIDHAWNIFSVCGHLLVLNYMVDSLKNSSEFTAHQCCTVDDCEKNIVDTNQPAINMNMDIPMSWVQKYYVLRWWW